MELSETNLADSELTHSEIKKSNDKGLLELELKNDNNDYISIVDDDKIELIIKALSSSTRRQILYHIKMFNEGMDVSKIASILDMTEANISAQIKKLEEAGLISCDYCSGQHGIRKISKLKYNEITLKF
jgi:predicted transcriptional regulator